MTLVGRLFDGPVDVIGDVHGELEVLEKLLHKLGYDDLGRHSAGGRRLVFVGDLVDRGPASLEVVERVRELVAAERAQCVLGNHELNVLRHDRKDGNGWFFDAIGPEQQASIRAFLETLPLALEREDLRVVHACWDEAHVERLRGVKGSIFGLARCTSAGIDEALAREGVLERAAREDVHELEDRDRKPPMLRALAEKNVRRQNAHQIKVLTSGREEIADEPFWAGGRWRFERRVRWWDDYAGPMCVVGHYWRSRVPSANHGKGVNLFEGVRPEARLGRRERVMCVDYSIGKRSVEREKGVSPYATALAALRWPEDRVVFSPA